MVSSWGNGFWRPAWRLSPQYSQAFLQCFSLLDQSSAVSLETYLYSRQLQLGAVKISVCACAAGQTSRGRGSAHQRIWWTETYSQQGVWSAGGAKGNKTAQRWIRDTSTDAKSKCGSKTSTQLATVQVTKSYLRQPTKRGSDCLHKGVWGTSKEQQLSAHSCRTQTPASPSSLGTCICGWKAASGQVAESLGCPCCQGELLSCHHRMPLDGSSALASPAGVWKRKEKRGDLKCLQTICLVPCPQQTSALPAERDPGCLSCTDSSRRAEETPGLPALSADREHTQDWHRQWAGVCIGLVLI